MVWRNLMQKVQSKQIIKEKRLQVFCNDFKISQSTKQNPKEVSTLIFNY